jgi:hypothetical protein
MNLQYKIMSAYLSVRNYFWASWEISAKSGTKVMELEADALLFLWIYYINDTNMEAMRTFEMVAKLAPLPPYPGTPDISKSCVAIQLRQKLIIKASFVESKAT